MAALALCSSTAAVVALQIVQDPLETHKLAVDVGQAVDAGQAMDAGQADAAQEDGMSNTSSNEVLPDLAQIDGERLVQRQGGERNLCMMGHFVPELFVIGGIKTSSTLLCTQLRGSPGIQWRYGSERLYGNRQHPAAWKEGHFFDDHVKEGAVYMAYSFPECRRDIRMVATEGSARYSADITVPMVMANWYGPLKDRPTFVLLIRDPIARLHSHYAHAVRDKWCKELEGMKFDQVVDQILKDDPSLYKMSRLGPEGSGCGDFMEGSFWKKHLERWFQNFSPRQFIVVPEQYNTAPGGMGRTEPPVAEYLWNFLGIKGTQLDLTMSRASANINPSKTTLQDELDWPRRSQLYEKYVDAWGGYSIAQILAGSGANLYGYRGSPDDVDGIANWLENNW